MIMNDWDHFLKKMSAIFAALANYQDRREMVSRNALMQVISEAARGNFTSSTVIQCERIPT
jgi:hypothetical protein